VGGREGMAVSRALRQRPAGVTAERWKEIKEIFACALERQAAERAEYLDAACAGDTSLRREVESLLASHQQEIGRAHV